MFGRDLALPLNTLLEPKLQYLGNDINILSLEAMKNMVEIDTTNLKIAQDKRDPKDGILMLCIMNQMYCITFRLEYTECILLCMLFEEILILYLNA